MSEQEPIKLTNGSFIISEKGDEIFVSRHFQMQIIPDDFPAKKKEILEEIQNKILENQEKAEKYDDLMKANSEIVQNNISHTETKQENKKLKEKLEDIKNWYADECRLSKNFPRGDILGEILGDKK